MTSETGNEAESPRRRGRIPQSAWPQILERYRTGATLSAIAREFECTPSAISYIVRKAEAAGTAGDAPTGDAENTAEPSLPLEAPAPAAPRAAAAPAAAAPVETPAAAPAVVAEPEPAPVAPAPAHHSSHGETLKLSRPEAGPPVSQNPAALAPAAAPAAAAKPAAAGPRPEPTPPVDNVEARLRETARTCLSTYRTWRQQPGETSIQSLSDAVHELRKALARIEIDMSASRKEEQAIRPIPIPAHRAARRHQ